MKRTKTGMVRGMRRGIILKRTKFPEKNCFIRHPFVPTRYLVSTPHYKNTPVLMTKGQAFQLHSDLKKKYYADFKVEMKIGKLTRILINK